MKKIISILLIVCTLLSVCSCTKKNDTDDEAVLPSVDEQESEKDDSEKEQQEQTDKEQSNTEKPKEESQDKEQSNTEKPKEESQDKEQSNTEKPKEEQSTQTNKEQESSKQDEDYKLPVSSEDEPVYEPSGSWVETEEGNILETGDHEVDDSFVITTDSYKASSEKWLKIDFPINDIIDCISPFGNSSLHMVITKSNELYYISLDKLFSNGLCCLKVNTDIKFKKFIDTASKDKAIVSTDGKVYFLEYGDIYGYNANLSWNDNTGLSENSCYIINDWYRYNDNKIFSTDGKEVYSFPQGENIEYIKNEYIKTTKGFYIMESEANQEFVNSEKTYKLSAKPIENTSEYRILYGEGHIDYGETVAIPK